MITKSDVQSALSKLDLPGDSVAKASDKNSFGDGEDLGDANGAANGEGDDDSLEAPGDDMNSKTGNKKEQGMKAQKSMPKDFYEGLPQEVETKVDVSNFLRSMVDHTADSIDGLRDFVCKSDMASETRFDEILAAVEGIQKSMGNVGIVLKALCERVGVLENEPASVAKSQTVAGAVEKTVQPLARTMPNNDPELNKGESKGIFKSLDGKAPHVARSMISESICELVKKSEAKDFDVINFETYGYISPELEPKLRAMLG